MGLFQFMKPMMQPRLNHQESLRPQPMQSRLNQLFESFKKGGSPMPQLPQFNPANPVQQNFSGLFGPMPNNQPMMQPNVGAFGNSNHSPFKMVSPSSVITPSGKMTNLDRNPRLKQRLFGNMPSGNMNGYQGGMPKFI